MFFALFTKKISSIKWILGLLDSRFLTKSYKEWNYEEVIRDIF